MVLKTKKSDIKKYLDSIKKLQNKLESAEAVIINAGKGLLLSAGFYSEDYFKVFFGEFEEKYDFHDMSAGEYYSYQSPEKYRAFWSRFIYYNCFYFGPKKVFKDLLSLIENKKYFITTTDPFNQFDVANFDTQKIHYECGSYRLFQCSKPCNKELYDSKEWVSNMVSTQKDLKVPEDLIPKCPNCGSPLTMHILYGDKFLKIKPLVIQERDMHVFGVNIPTPM